MRGNMNLIFQIMNEKKKEKVEQIPLYIEINNTYSNYYKEKENKEEERVAIIEIF